MKFQNFNVNIRAGLYHGIAQTASSDNRHSQAIIERLELILQLEGKDPYKFNELNELIPALGSLDDDDAIEK